MHGNYIIFHRSLLSHIISHLHHRHSFVLVNSVLLNKATQTQDSFFWESVPVTRGHSNDVKIRLLPHMYKYIISSFYLVKSAYVATPRSPRDFSRKRLVDGKNVRKHLYILVL